jgi:hypothetical protein
MVVPRELNVQTGVGHFLLEGKYRIVLPTQWWKDQIIMSIGPNGVTIYRLPPEEVERLLTIKYGNKIVAVNAFKLAKLNQKRAKYDAAYRNADVEKT